MGFGIEFGRSRESSSSFGPLSAMAADRQAHQPGGAANNAASLLDAGPNGQRLKRSNLLPGFSEPSYCGLQQKHGSQMRFEM